MIQILSPVWGHEDMDIIHFLDKITEAGYDGIDSWLPESAADKSRFLKYLEANQRTFVAHQHQASGTTFDGFKRSFLYHLHICAAANPVLINSHTGKDYFSFDQNLELIDIALEFSEKHKFPVAHETHRGRWGGTPFQMEAYFKARQGFFITADLSHWTCVTESMLEAFEDVLQETFQRTRHVHARVGYEQGPQVPDPRAPEFAYALDRFTGFWDQIVDNHHQRGGELLTFTTEFGPPPYMPQIPYTKEPVANQFEINVFMKDWLRNRFTNGHAECPIALESYCSNNSWRPVFRF